MTVAGVVVGTDPADDGPGPLSLLAGRPLLAWAVAALRNGTALDQLILIISGVAEPDVVAALDHSAPGHGALVVAGEPTRHASLHRALSILDSHIEIVVLHDADRPLTPPIVVSRVVDAVRRGAPGAVPVAEVTETVKELDPADRVGLTVPRESLLRTQTPQAVLRSHLDAAHASCTPADLTIDSPPGLLVRPELAHPVDGDPAALPIGSHAELALAEAILAARHTQPA